MILIGLIILGGIIMGISNAFLGQYNNPTIIGEWTSQETGKVVEFTRNGMVNVDGVKIGDYTVGSPKHITYEIEGHIFEMDYTIADRKLSWGLPGEQEIFDRKGM